MTMTLKASNKIASSLGFPSKMPGTSYGISAHTCKTGSKLAKQKDTVCSGCYALKANYAYPSVMIAHERRIAAIYHPQWVPAMVKMLSNAHGLTNGKVHRKIVKAGYHRWHDSGDLQSVKHLQLIVDIANLLPSIKFWLPIKELQMLLTFIKNGGIVPSNLVIRVSAYKVDQAPTKKWLHGSSVSDKMPPRPNAHECPAPKQEGKCGPCDACWNPNVKEISYHKH